VDLFVGCINVAATGECIPDHVHRGLVTEQPFISASDRAAPQYQRERLVSLAMSCASDTVGIHEILCEVFGETAGFVR
jgi:hypothetical protein